MEKPRHQSLSELFRSIFKSNFEYLSWWSHEVIPSMLEAKSPTEKKEWLHAFVYSLFTALKTEEGKRLPHNTRISLLKFLKNQLENYYTADAIEAEIVQADEVPEVLSRVLVRVQSLSDTRFLLSSWSKVYPDWYGPHMSRSGFEKTT